jgi:DNA primase
MRAAAPIVANIRDTSMRPEYTRTVAGWIGVEVEQVQAEVARAGRMAAREAKGEGSQHGGAAHRDVEAVPEPSAEEARAALPAPDLRDPVIFAERQLLQCLLQFPSLFDAAEVDAIAPDSFGAPAHRAVFDGIRAAGGLQPGLSERAWADKVTEAAPLAVRPLVSELAVAPLPTRFDKATGLPERRYTNALLVRVQEISLTRKIADAMSAMRRMAADPHSDPGQARALSAELQTLQRELASLRERVS